MFQNCCGVNAIASHAKGASRFEKKTYLPESCLPTAEELLLIGTMKKKLTVLLHQYSSRRGDSCKTKRK